MFVELTLLLVSDVARAVAVVGIHILPAVAVAPILLDDDFVLVFGWFVHRANIRKVVSSKQKVLVNPRV